MNGWHIPLISTVRSGELPCAVCGVSTIPDPDVEQISLVRPHPTNPKLFDTLLFTRCGPHVEQFKAWKSWATRNPAVVGVRDPDIAAALAESLACAAQVLGFEGNAGSDLLIAAGLAQHPENGPAWTLRFVDYVAANRLESGRCASVPFGFVTRETVATLRCYTDDARALAAGNPRLIWASEAVYRVTNPDDELVGSGCFGCSVEAVPAPFPGARPHDVWTPYDVGAVEFGQSVHRGRAAGRVWGVLCPICLPHAEAGNGVGGQLPASLLAKFYGLGEEDQIVNGPVLLWAGYVVRARRMGWPEPRSVGAWQHLPRNGDGEWARPSLEREYSVPTLPAQTGKSVLDVLLNGMQPNEAAALIERLTAEPEPVPSVPTADDVADALTARLQNLRPASRF